MSSVIFVSVKKARSSIQPRQLAGPVVFAFSSAWPWGRYRQKLCRNVLNGFLWELCLPRQPRRGASPQPWEELCLDLPCARAPSLANPRCPGSSAESLQAGCDMGHRLPCLSDKRSTQAFPSPQGLHSGSLCKKCRIAKLDVDFC